MPVARDVGSGRIVPGREVINPGNGMIDRIEAVAELGNRRSLYMEARRSRPLTVLEAFDLPVMNPNCTARTVTSATTKAVTKPMPIWPIPSRESSLRAFSSE